MHLKCCVLGWRCENRTAGRWQQWRMGRRPVQYPPRWPLNVKAELPQWNRNYCREAFILEKQSGGDVSKSMSNKYKSCEIREVAPGTGNSKSLGELELRYEIVIWQYLPKIYIALKVK